MSNKKLTTSHLCQQIEYISIKQIVYWINKHINYLAKKLWLVICWKCNFMHGPAKLFTILCFIIYTRRSGMHKKKKNSIPRKICTRSSSIFVLNFRFDCFTSKGFEIRRRTKGRWRMDTMYQNGSGYLAQSMTSKNSRLY